MSKSNYVNEQERLGLGWNLNPRQQHCCLSVASLLFITAASCLTLLTTFLRFASGRYNTSRFVVCLKRGVRGVSLALAISSGSPVPFWLSDILLDCSGLPRVQLIAAEQDTAEAFSKTDSFHT